MRKWVERERAEEFGSSFFSFTHDAAHVFHVGAEDSHAFFALLGGGGGAAGGGEGAVFLWGRIHWRGGGHYRFWRGGLWFRPSVECGVWMCVCGKKKVVEGVRRREERGESGENGADGYGGGSEAERGERVERGSEAERGEREWRGAIPVCLSLSLDRVEGRSPSRSWWCGTVV